MAPHQAGKGQNWLWARIMRLFAFAVAPGRPSPLSLLHGGHLSHGYKQNQIWLKVKSKLLVTFRFLNESQIYESTGIHFPHLSVKPALINGGIQPGAARTSLCAQNHSKIENLSVQREGFMQSKHGGPGQSGCD